MPTPCTSCRTSTYIPDDTGRCPACVTARNRPSLHADGQTYRSPAFQAASKAAPGYEGIRPNPPRRSR